MDEFSQRIEHVFPGPVERYLAEIRAGASDDDALTEADADREALERWMRNKAFREARKEALGESAGSPVGEEYVMVAKWGATEFWAPKLKPKPVGAPDQVPFPPRVRMPAPWQRRRTVFSASPPPGLGL